MSQSYGSPIRPRQKVWATIVGTLIVFLVGLILLPGVGPAALLALSSMIGATSVQAMLHSRPSTRVTLAAASGFFVALVVALLSFGIEIGDAAAIALGGTFLSFAGTAWRGFRHRL